MISRPMKAPSEPIEDKYLHDINYPMVGSPKLDGYRCIVGDRPYTSTMKKFPNLFVNEVLSDPLYHNLDGELVIGDPTDPHVFNNSSGLRKIEGTPDFRFCVFDSLLDRDKSYEYRWLMNQPKEEGRLIVLPQVVLYGPDDVLQFEADMRALGYEGAMIRSLMGRYKEGRCTYREMNMFKRKPFAEIEGVIIGCVEAMENLNEPTLDERGLTKRSKCKDNLVPKGTLGSLWIKAPKWEQLFTAALGKGYDDNDKQRVWDNRAIMPGTVATVKYQAYGSIDRPRIPSVIKFRPPWDL